MHFRHPALVVSAIVIAAAASSGDRSSDFQECISRCDATTCQSSEPPVLPFTLRLTCWTCTDNCKYLCMHKITDRDVERGDRVQQYYGKWPFRRLAGIQEPASVVFSLMNLGFHLRGFLEVQKRVAKSHPMRSYYSTWSFISINAWLWSSVFHTRDLPWTEKMDYFSAALSILYALYYTVIRLFHLYATPRHRMVISSSSQNLDGTARKAWSYLCAVIYLGHISYLTLLPRFDYAYNMAFNVALGLTHNFLWLCYSLPTSLTFFQRFQSRPKSYRPAFVNKAALLVGLMTAATALELFDFPPLLRVIDAHSLWHLATVPMVMWWYNFVIEDASDGSWREQGHDSESIIKAVGKMR